MGTPLRQLPKMPPIGEPEHFYSQRAKRAAIEDDRICVDLWKVGQYCTLALNPKARWDEKLAYYCHALERHCQPPTYPDDEVWIFYRELTGLVQSCAGREALRMANLMDEWFSRRLRKGEPRETVENDAECFFMNMLPPGERPVWFSEADYFALMMVRDRWI